MRQQELMDGMTLTDEAGDTACLSKTCAADGIGKVSLKNIFSGIKIFSDM